MNGTNKKTILLISDLPRIDTRILTLSDGISSFRDERGYRLRRQISVQHKKSGSVILQGRKNLEQFI